MTAKVSAILGQLPLSATVRQKMEGYHADGNLAIRANATVPLQAWKDASYEANLQLQSARASFPGIGVNVDRADAEANIAGSRKSGMTLSLKKWEMTAGKSAFSVDGGQFTSSADGTEWKLADLLGRLDLNGGVPALDKLHFGGRLRFTAGASGPMIIPRGSSALSVIAHQLIVYPAI